jgi:hypothetical protein
MRGYARTVRASLGMDRDIVSPRTHSRGDFAVSMVARSRRETEADQDGAFCPSKPYWMASGALMKAALLQENMNLYACAARFCILPPALGRAAAMPSILAR